MLSCSPWRICRGWGMLCSSGILRRAIRVQRGSRVCLIVLRMISGLCQLVQFLECELCLLLIHNAMQRVPIRNQIQNDLAPSFAESRRPLQHASSNSDIVPFCIPIDVSQAFILLPKFSCNLLHKLKESELHKQSPK